MKLLVERVDFDTEIICESDESGKRNYFISGPFVQCEIKNRNQRKYPMSVVRPEIARYIKENVEQGSGLGELNHPTNPSINLDRVSHKIISLQESGTDFVGKAKILDTPMGKIVKNLMDESVKFGVSSRALGSTKLSEGVHIVCEDLHIVTPADIVSDPSGPSCWVHNLMENKEWVWEDGKLIEFEKPLKNLIDNLSSKKKLDEEAMLRIFEFALSKI